MPHESQRGFTLVELSIVMIIIGLLIGGVLKGQEMILSSKTNATIAQIKSFQAAHNTFRDSYGGAPGDSAVAQGALPNCNATMYCASGNGNLRIGAGQTSLTQDVSGDNENTQYWKHLALADLIGGVDPGANPILPEWGKTFPASKFSGGFQIFFQSNLASGVYGHYYKLTQNTGTHSSQIGQHPLTPRVASIIDTKLDDNMPGTGNVRSFDANLNGGNTGCQGPAPYDTKSERGDCIMLFKFEVN